MLLQAIGEVQIALLAVMLLLGCGAKLRLGRPERRVLLTKGRRRVRRTGLIDVDLGPTALFPIRLRRPMAIIVSALEGGLGLGLILTAIGSHGPEALAIIVRAGTGMFLLVATFALIELRQTRPNVGCGCFGDFSTAPVSRRTVARSALLAIAALATIGLRPIAHFPAGRQALGSLGVFCAELLLMAALSPEVREGLVRFGYSEPCEVRIVPSARTIAMLRRSRAWRRYAGLITADLPVDVWRELCWRYVVYPASYLDSPAEVVFAVFLQQWGRPAVRAAVVDGVTGVPVHSPGAFRAPLVPEPGRMLRAWRAVRSPVPIRPGVPGS